MSMCRCSHRRGIPSWPPSYPALVRSFSYGCRFLLWHHSVLAADHAKMLGLPELYEACHCLLHLQQTFILSCKRTLTI